MSKVTKRGRIKELERQVKGLTVLFSSLNTWSEYADSMLTELNHALPDPEYDAKCEAQEADIDASLDRHRERLGLNKPQLKQLDQSVFDGEPEQIKWAMVTSEGAVLKLEFKPVIKDGLWYWIGGCRQHSLIGQYDASNWQNSLIERDTTKELTGSELCKAMLARGDGYVVCLVSNVADSHAIKNREHTTLIEQWVERDGFYNYRSQNWGHAVPANPATNEPLTAAEAGL